VEPGEARPRNRLRPLSEYILIRRGVSYEKAINGSAVVLSLLTEDGDRPDEFLHFVAGGCVEPVSRQRRLLATEPVANKRWRLSQLKSICEWVDAGCRAFRFDANTVPKNWCPDFDACLLRAV
jgi:hypothetical protein